MPINLLLFVLVCDVKKKKDFAFLKPELYNTSDCQDVAMWSFNVFLLHDKHWYIYSTVFQKP